MSSFIVYFALLAASDSKYLEWIARPIEATTLPASSGERLSQVELETLADNLPRLPFTPLTVGVRLADGTLWVGSSKGLMHLPPGSPRWRLFHSRRWLPADDVQELS